jgi:hypothetical protein
MPTFEKGKSGNPGGRPKVLGDIQELFRERTKEARDGLVTIIRDPKAPAAARVAACNTILDRGYGRPAQTVHATTLRKTVEELTDEELMIIAAGGTLEDSAAGQIN